MSSYLSRLKHYAWIVLACAVLITTVGVIIVVIRPPIYQATSILRTTYSSDPLMSSPGPSSDDLGLALNYAVEIPTSPVMDYVLQFDPTLAQHHYRANDLIGDVTTSVGTTSPTITITAHALAAQDAVLIANDVAKGFAAYRQWQAQQHLDALRKNLTDQIGVLQQQIRLKEGKSVPSIPTESARTQGLSGHHYYMDDLYCSPSPSPPSDCSGPPDDPIHTLQTLQAQLSALPATVNGDLIVVHLATMKDVVLA